MGYLRKGGQGGCFACGGVGRREGTDTYTFKGPEAQLASPDPSCSLPEGRGPSTSAASAAVGLSVAGRAGPSAPPEASDGGGGQQLMRPVRVVERLLALPQVGG